MEWALVLMIVRMIVVVKMVTNVVQMVVVRPVLTLPLTKQLALLMIVVLFP
jgi:hypothetical protein